MKLECIHQMLLDVLSEHIHDQFLSKQFSFLFWIWLVLASILCISQPILFLLMGTALLWSCSHLIFKVSKDKGKTVKWLLHDILSVQKIMEGT